MLPSERFLAAFLMGLLLLQMVPAVEAQSGQSDLQVISITTDKQPVVGQVVVVAVAVQNTGTRSTASTSFEVYIEEDGECLDRQDNPNDFFPPKTNESSPNRGCVRVFSAATGSTTVAAGARVTQTFEWVPQSNQAGMMSLRSTIRMTGGDPDDITGNNVRTHAEVFKVIEPLIEAEAVRVAPNADRKVNDAWRDADIVTDCPSTSETHPDPSMRYITTGCRAAPGQELNYRFLVYNRGNHQDVVTPSFTGIAPFVAKGYDFRFSSNKLTVSTTDPAVLGVTITVPREAEANEKFNVNTVTSRVVVTSGWDPDTVTVSPPSMPSLVVKRMTGLNLTTNDTLRIANVSESVTFDVRLNNTGNAPDDYLVKMLHGTGTINGSWNIPAPQVIRVDPGELNATTLRLQLEPPRNATVGLHGIDLQVESLTDTTGDTLRTLRLTADLQQNYSIRGQVLTDLASRVPAEDVSFTLRIHNDGNGHDNVTLRLSPMPAGWTGGLSRTVVEVPPHSFSDVHLNVTSPPNAQKDREFSFWVNATSSGPTKVSQELRAKTQPMSATVRILPGSNIRLDAPSTSAFLDAGETTRFQLRLVNTGNEPDRFRITNTSSSAAWRVSSSITEIDLQPLQGVDVTVELTAPTLTDVGETNDVEIRVSSLADPNRVRDVRLEGRISGPDLFVGGVLLNSTNPYAGDSLQVNVVFGNAGNKQPPQNATLRVFLLKEGGETEIGTMSIDASRLRGGVRLTETFAWNDTLSYAGEGVIFAIIDPDDLIEEIDESDSSNQASLPVTLRTFDIALVPALGLEGRPGERIGYTEAPYTFIVEHRGNAPVEPVRILIESANGWGKRDYTVDLQQGVRTNITLELDIPETPGVGRDRLNVTVTPTLRPTSLLRAHTFTTVLDNEKPVISGITVQPDVAVFGERVTFSATLSDATGLKHVRAVVVTPQDETEVIEMTHESGDTWVASGVFGYAGLHRVYVEALDQSLTGPNTNSTRERAVTFTIKPGSVPTIELADGQSTNIRTGSLVKLNISDPLGVGRVTYSLKGLTYDLPFPYQIDTTGFQEGTAEVSVTAENIYGANATETFRFTVSNAPPGINRVVMSPENPRANEDVTFTIETDPSVLAVDVIIKRDGEVLETREATKQRDGVFTIELNPGAGDYVIDVSAKDAAGNTRLESGAVVFSAKPASFLPAPGLVAMAVALVGVAWALRRRG